MEFATAKELRQNVRKILEKAKRGTKIAITYRGKPVAIVAPFESVFFEEEGKPRRTLEEAWQDIETQLAKTRPAFPDWKEAMAYSRRRK